MTKRKDESIPFNKMPLAERQYYQAMDRIEKYEAVFVELQRLLASDKAADVGRARELLVKTMQEREK
jgi:hypothetical protein